MIYRPTETFWTLFSKRRGWLYFISFGEDAGRSILDQLQLLNQLFKQTFEGIAAVLSSANLLIMESLKVNRWPSFSIFLSLKGFQTSLSSISLINSHQLSCPCWSNTFPQHNSASTLWMICSQYNTVRYFLYICYTWAKKSILET